MTEAAYRLDKKNMRPFMNPLASMLVRFYLMLLIIRPQEYDGWPPEFAILAIVEAFAVLTWAGDRKQLYSLSTLYLAILNFAIFASLVFISPGIAISESINYFLTILLMFLLVSHAVDTIDRHLQVARVLVWSVVVVALHCVDQYFDPSQTGWTGQTMSFRTDSGDALYQARYLGIFSDPNDLGMLLTASIPMSFLLIGAAKSGLSKFVYVGVIALTIYAIYLTNSRGTYLATIAMLGTYFWYRTGTFKTMMLGLAALPVLIVAAPSRFATALDESSLGRVDGWWAGLQMWKAYPIFGVGKDQYTEHHILTAHNSWILALAEIGTVGYLAWCAFLFSSMFYAYRIVITPVAKFMAVGMSEERAKLETMVAKSTFSGLVACCVSMMFLSRTFMQLIYLIAALVVGQAFRIYAEHPSITPEDVWGKVILASAASGGVILVAMIAFL